MRMGGAEQRNERSAVFEQSVCSVGIPAAAAAGRASIIRGRQKSSCYLLAKDGHINGGGTEETRQQASFLMDFLWLAVRSWSRHMSALQLMMICAIHARNEEKRGTTEEERESAGEQKL